MVGFVLLIVLIVGSSIAVYSFLRAYVPKERPGCPEDISLIVQDYSCNSSLPEALNVTITNRGLFTVDAMYIRVGIPGRAVRQWINDPEDLIPLRQEEKFFIDLAPGDSVQYTYDTSSIVEANTPAEYVLEVQPAITTEENILAACEEAVITQPIQCD